MNVAPNMQELSILSQWAMADESIAALLSSNDTAITMFAREGTLCDCGYACSMQANSLEFDEALD
jgi:hypothetical protein